MQTGSALPPPRIFYGWFVVAAAFTVTLIGFGSAYSFSAFVAPLQQEFAASRGSVSLVFSLAGFLYFGLGVISGPLADRFGVRPLAIAGMVCVGAGLALAGMARSLTEVYLGYGLGVGIGAGLSYVPVLGTVQRWFLKRRGFASGLAVSGIGVGTLIMPPIAAALVELYGWRTAYLTLGAAAACVGVGMSLLLVDDPGSRGLRPDGDPIPSDKTAGTHTDAAGGARVGATVGEAIRSRMFVVLYVACVISSFGVFVPFVHLVPYAMDQGVPKSAAVLLLGAIGVGSTAGRFVLGGLADRMGRQQAMLAGFVGMALSLTIWLVSSTFWPLAAFAFVFGVCYGGWVAVTPAVVMDAFGGRHVSGILGALYTSVAFGTLIGPTAAGFAYDVTGSYTLPIASAIAANVVAAAIVASNARMTVSRPS